MGPALPPPLVFGRAARVAPRLPRADGRSCGWLLRLALCALLPRLGAAQLCSGQQNFPLETTEFIRDIEPGVPINDTLCPQHWIWFRVRTRFPVTSTRLALEGTTWSQQPETAVLPHGLSIALDAGYDDVNYRFTTLSMIVVNGTPPADILRADPYIAADYSAVYHAYEEYTDRETLAFGYNDTIGDACQLTLADDVFVALRCVHPLGANPGPCGYNLTITALPRVLRNGDDFEAYLRPVSVGIVESVRHYYTIGVSAYEMLRLSVERRGEGRALHASDGSPVGVGLAGGVYISRLVPGGACPANASDALVQACSLGLNDSAACTLGTPCSAAGDGGLGGLGGGSSGGGGGGGGVGGSLDQLVVMIEAVVGNDRPVTFIDQPNSPYRLGCEPQQTGTLCQFVRNLVGRDGLRPDRSAIPGAEDRPPRYNVPSLYIPVSPDWTTQVNNRNELRADRGVYRLSVVQYLYAEGEMVSGESRPGCVSYGQWRYYRVSTTGRSDASLTAHVVAHSGRGVGGVYVRQHSAPTAAAHLAMVGRASPADAPQRVTASPCDVSSPTTWHIAVYLEPRSVGVSRGVPPTSFTLSIHLESALLPHDGSGVQPRVADGGVVAAKGAGGDGFACCGAFKYFLVPDVPSQLSLEADLQLTRGDARGVFLKARSCPAYPADVADEKCVGQCVVAWATTFNPYDGVPLSVQRASPIVPNGLGAGCPAACPADLRHGGEWYVGVLALPGAEAEFSLNLRLVEPPPIATGHTCDRNAPRCRAPLDGLSDSAAASARAPARVAMASTLGAAVLLLRAGRGARRRGQARGPG